MTTEMSDNETVDDVLADMLLPRFDAITAMRANNYVEIKSLVANYRDRIKAAYKREVEKLNSVIQAQRSAFDAEQDIQRRAASGDAAAMREALEELMKFTCNCCQERYCEEDIEEEDGQRIPSPCSVIIKARAALALPRRQCDVGTAEEQLLRFEKHCNNYNEYCDGCPLPQIWHRGDMIGKCSLAWAQMPYTESEATDGK